MHGEEAAYYDAPFDCFVGLVEAKNCLELESVILARLLVRVVIKEVFLRWFIVSDVTSAELVNTFHFFGVGPRSLIKRCWLLTTLSN